jgi:predicted porin
MNRSLFAFAALGGCAAVATAQAQDGIAVFTRDQPATQRAPASQPQRAPGAVLFPWYGSLGSDASLYPTTREYSLEYLALADVGDPYGGSAAGHAANIIANGNRRLDDGVQFYSPPVHGLSGGASYTRDDTRDPSNRAWGLSLGYSFGPITLRAAHQNKHVAKIRLYDLAGNNLEAKNSLIAANVHFGWGTAYAAFSANSGWGSSPLFNPDNPYSAAMASTPSTDSRDVLLGVAVPLGRSTTFLASFAHKNDRDRANRDANELAIGASYTVNRKTDFYAAYSLIQNLSIDGLPRTSYDARGQKNQAFSFGMRHSF